jgi:hypothetical protein
LIAMHAMRDVPKAPPRLLLLLLLLLLLPHFC